MVDHQVFQLWMLQITLSLTYQRKKTKLGLRQKRYLEKLKDGKIEPADIRVSCTCTRVPVIDGHTESVFVETEKEVDPKNAKETYEQYNKEISVVGLPSAPKRLLCST